VLLNILFSVVYNNTSVSYVSSSNPSIPGCIPSDGGAVLDGSKLFVGYVLYVGYLLTLRLWKRMRARN